MHALPIEQAPMLPPFVEVDESGAAIFHLSSHFKFTTSAIDKFVACFFLAVVTLMTAPAAGLTVSFGQTALLAGAILLAGLVFFCVVEASVPRDHFLRTASMQAERRRQQQSKATAQKQVSAPAAGSVSGDSTMTQFSMELDAAYEASMAAGKKLQ